MPIICGCTSCTCWHLQVRYSCKPLVKLLECPQTCSVDVQEDGFSPIKSGPAYTPALKNALPAPRGPSPLGPPAAPPSTNIQRVGDLFRPPGGSLPNVAIPECPALPAWNQQRPYLTGQYLLESLELEDASASRHQALESFSPAVQELVGELALPDYAS